MNYYAVVAGLGGTELLILVFVLLLLFGSTRLPKLAKSIGTSLHEFKRGVEELGPENIEQPARASTPKRRKAR